LAKNNHTDIISIQNASGNGIDIISRAPDGRLVFTEVKTTGVGTVGNLSKRQQDPVAFVDDILTKVATGDSRYKNMSAAEKANAIKFLDELDDLPTRSEMTSYAVGVDLQEKVIRISPWRSN
jgi:filamentous hemagglutinin